MFSQACRERIEREYQELTASLPQIGEELSKGMAGCREEVKLALKYLYGHMPFSDVGNYDCSVMRDFAEHGVKLLENPRYSTVIPEEIFLNYVLYHRVNSEGIEPCRTFFFEKLKRRTQGMTMKEAALEVNYWCAEEAAYKSTDGRTLSAMGVYRNVFGRCGEESVFAVNVMRSIGIPARQVYVPWWSHCDDNHAWVEVWCDGQWYFLGACEPEPILNKGWFNDAASRAMMVHARWFDTAAPQGEIVGREGMVTMENQISRYAFSKTAKVTVKDEDGRCAAGAKVRFEVLNYAGLCEIAAVETKEDGTAVVQTGYGDLWIEAYLDGKCAEGLLKAREETCTVTLGKRQADYQWEDFDMMAPADAPLNKQQPTPDQKAEAAVRCQTAVEKRNRKCQALRFTEIEHFERTHQKKKRLTEAFLNALSEKDLRDGNCAVLEEHYEDAMEYSGQMEEELFVSYVMNPRIGNEMMKRWRKAIRSQFGEKQAEQFRADPKSIWRWIEDTIVERPEKEHAVLITTPADCLRLGIGSRLSKKTLFVAVARTFGIPARLNPMDGAMEYWTDGGFAAVEQEKEKEASIRIFSDDPNRKWIYYNNWSLAKETSDGYKTMDLSDAKVTQEGLRILAEPGNYRVITANRLPNGNVFAKRYLFCVKSKEEQQVVLRQREADLSDMLENIAILPFNLTDQAGRKTEAKSLTEGKKAVLFWLEEGKEPTEHIINELTERKEEFSKYEDRLIFIVRNQRALKQANLRNLLAAFPGASLYYDDFSENVPVLGRRMYVDPEKLPLILVTDGSLNGIYAASGYNVGTGDLLLRILETGTKTFS